MILLLTLEILDGMQDILERTVAASRRHQADLDLDLDGDADLSDVDRRVLAKLGLDNDHGLEPLDLRVLRSGGSISGGGAASSGGKTTTVTPNKTFQQVKSSIPDHVPIIE